MLLEPRPVVELLRETRMNGEGRVPEPGAAPFTKPDDVVRFHRAIDAPIPGGAWVLSATGVVPAVWGRGNQVLWSEGEGLLIVGGDGTGKTTLLHHLLLRLTGVIVEPLLGFEVVEVERVLLLAQDRPAQAKRALRRMVGLIHGADLDERLAVVDYPLAPLESDPGLLADLARQAGAKVILVDSLKDMVLEPSDEKTGLAVKRAFSLALAAGVEVAASHHDRKQTSQGRPGGLRLSDVFGSRWITAGAGSVIGLVGSAGDPLIEVRHMKAPAIEVGPLRLAIDHDTGDMQVVEGSDLIGVLTAATNGLTATDAARLMYGATDPSRADRERGRRALRRLVEEGRAREEEGHGQTATRYFATAKRPHDDLTQGSKP